MSTPIDLADPSGPALSVGDDCPACGVVAAMVLDEDDELVCCACDWMYYRPADDDIADDVDNLPSADPDDPDA